MAARRSCCPASVQRGLAPAASGMGDDVAVTSNPPPERRQTGGSSPAVQSPQGRGVSLRGAGLVALGLTISQIISLAQMLVASRVLGPVEFGVFGSLAVIALLGSTAMAATQVVLARHVALGATTGSSADLAIRTIAWGSAACGVLAAPALAWLLRLPDWWGPLTVAASFAPMTYTGAQQGRLQGQERFARLGVLYVVATSLRVGAGVAGALLFGTADAAVTGALIGTIGAAVAGRWVEGAPPPRGRLAPRARVFALEIGHAGHALIALYALTNVDVLLARSQLSAHAAGLYAAGQLVNRAVFFLPQAVLVAAFPRMVGAAGERARRQSVLAVAGIGLVATLGTALLPQLVLAVLAGAQYADVTSLLWIFALAGAGFAVAQVLLYARLAEHDRRAAVLMWMGFLLLVALGVTIGQRGVGALAGCAAGVAWSVVAAGLLVNRARAT